MAIIPAQSPPHVGTAKTVRLRAFAFASLLWIVLAATLVQANIPPAILSALSASGIPVSETWTEAARTTAPAHPTIAPLDGFPVGPEPKRYWFVNLFEAGAFHDAVLLATKKGAGARPKTATGFLNLWKRTPASQRIFISYTKADAEAAQSVAKALTSKGYVCFTYLHGKTTLLNSVQVGQCFSEAGNHLVIDSANARASDGVRWEALSLHAKKTNTKVPIPAYEQERIDEMHCCKLCTYVNGALTGCVYLGCGPQCAGAQ